MMLDVNDEYSNNSDDDDNIIDDDVKIINTSSFLCDCKIKWTPCGQGRILSSTALCGLIVTLTFILLIYIVHILCIYIKYT